MKLNQIQFSNLKEGVADAIDQLEGGGRPQQLLSEALAELFKKLHNLSVFPKERYNVKLSPVQKVALVHAIELGFFEFSDQVSITSGNIMMDLHKQLK